LKWQPGCLDSMGLEDIGMLLVSTA